MFNGPTNYQLQLNQGGRLGPANSALWENTTTITGNPYDLSAHPLYYSPFVGKYVTSSDVPGSIGSVSFGFGGKRRKSRRNRRGRKSRKGSRNGRKSKKSRRGRKSVRA